jgi:hypothetical protein
MRILPTRIWFQAFLCLLIARFKGETQASLQAKYQKQHCPALAPPVCTKRGFILEHAQIIRILIGSDLSEIRIAKQQLTSHWNW